VLDRAERRTKTGNKLGIVTLSDQTGHFEAIIFSESSPSVLAWSWSTRAAPGSSMSR
jgi:DNA polymerase III alpha subunit